MERPDDEAYADSYFVNANSTTAPGIVDADRQPILDHSEVYSGVYGRASINFYAFNSNGNKGIACGLNNLQKIRDGEPLAAVPVRRMTLRMKPGTRRTSCLNSIMGHSLRVAGNGHLLFPCRP